MFFSFFLPIVPLRFRRSAEFKGRALLALRTVHVYFFVSPIPHGGSSMAFWVLGALGYLFFGPSLYKHRSKS